MPNTRATKTLGLTVREDYPWKGREFRLKLTHYFNLMWDSMPEQLRTDLSSNEDVKLLSELLI